MIKNISESKWAQFHQDLEYLKHHQSGVEGFDNMFGLIVEIVDLAPLLAMYIMRQQQEQPQKQQKQTAEPKNTSQTQSTPKPQEKGASPSVKTDAAREAAHEHDLEIEVEESSTHKSPNPFDTSLKPNGS